MNTLQVFGLCLSLAGVVLAAREGQVREAAWAAVAGVLWLRLLSVSL